MLENGFGWKYRVESPVCRTATLKFLNHHMALLHQYGGCSETDRIDEVLAPVCGENYKSFLRIRKSEIAAGEDMLRKKTQKTHLRYVRSLGMKSTPLHFSGAKHLFTSLGFGLGTSRFERENSSYLDHSYQGLGSGNTTTASLKHLLP